MNNAKPLKVVIVEDEPHLADLHREFIEQHFHLRVAGIAATLEQARQLIEQHQPRLVLLDHYLPDGQGVTLIDDPLLKRFDCSVIFITAASDMQTCSHAMRSGALDYLLKPVFFHRLRASLERFMLLVQTMRQMTNVDQHALDKLFNLPASDAPPAPSVEQVVESVGISKTTGRRYLEYCVEIGFIGVEMQYGNIGHPRRLYRKISGL